ncbi:MAG: hypothetical protein ABI833_10825, partial [Acidobacteriota bacterium]
MPYDNIHIIFFLASVLIGCRSMRAETDLISELQQKSEKEGLALVRLRGNLVDLIPFGSDLIHCVRGNTGFILTGISPDGLKVIIMDYQGNLTINRIDGQVLMATSALKFPNMQSWLSPDGKRLLFLTLSNSSISGLYIADLTSNRVEFLERELPPPGLSYGLSKSAGWSRDGTSVVYAHERQIIKLDLGSRMKSTLANGTNPSWSPDGKWIAYKGEDGTARLIASDRSLQKDIMPGHQILGYLHWSPDSEYLMFGENFKPDLLEAFERFGSSSRLSVYRIRDGAVAPVYWSGMKGGS